MWSDMGWTNYSPWGSSSTIKARDSDDLSGFYSVQDRLRSDYARNFPEINVYASDELRGLTPEMQERLLKLPKERRVDIYRNMDVVFSEDAVEAAGGYRQFMSAHEHSGYRDMAANMVNEAATSEAIGANLAAAKPKGTFAQGTYDDIELQPLLDKADPDLDARAAKTAQAQKDALADKKGLEAIKELDALIQVGGGGYPEDDGILADLKAILADSKKAAGPRNPGIELQEVRQAFEDDPELAMDVAELRATLDARAMPHSALDDMLLNRFDEVDAGPEPDPFAAAASEGLIDSGEAGVTSIADGAGKKSFAGKVKGAVKSVAKAAKGLFGKSGDLEAPPPPVENPLIIRGPPPDEMDGKESETGAGETLRGSEYQIANDEVDATEMTSLLRKVVPLGRESGIKAFPTEAMAVRGNGEFWITRTGLKNWLTESATGFIGSSLVIGPALQLVDAMTGNQGWGSYVFFSSGHSAHDGKPHRDHLPGSDGALESSRRVESQARGELEPGARPRQKDGLRQTGRQVGAGSLQHTLRGHWALGR